ncbi:hypothetical protein EVAR_86983_1 [Eumeta japonica]|uniref:Uncharacterized protein n=1 Tax=Eumeta variegata TaxID=151549 RepID=A0A4C1W781_EUMVA|nr:hypothetical protein EVAR_86983_1 [Eumeta japonica]
MDRRDELIVQWSRESFNEGKQVGDLKSDSEADEVIQSDDERVSEINSPSEYSNERPTDDVGGGRGGRARHPITRVTVTGGPIARPLSRVARGGGRAGARRFDVPRCGSEAHAYL